MLLRRSALAGGAAIVAVALLVAPASAEKRSPLLVEKSTGVRTVKDGGTIAYTITVRNTGTDALPSVSVAEDLGEALDDATYNGDAAGPGAPAGLGPPGTLTWTFPLAAGATATLTYSLTTTGAGDRRAASALRVSAPGYSSAGVCRTVVPVLRTGPDIALVKNVSRKVAMATTTVVYRVLIANRGDTAGTVDVTDDLTDVIDDASFQKASSSQGAAPVYTAPRLTWSGEIAPGGNVTVTYEVRVGTRWTNAVLNNAVTAPGTNCVTGQAAECRTRVPVSSLRLTKSGPPPNGGPPGTVLNYIIVARNDGAYDLVGDYPALAYDDMSQLVDDADYNNDAAGGPGTATWASPRLNVRAELKVGESTTWRYSVTAKAGGNGDFVNAFRSATNIPTDAPPDKPLPAPDRDDTADGDAIGRCRLDPPAPVPTPPTPSPSTSTTSPPPPGPTPTTPHGLPETGGDGRVLLGLLAAGAVAALTGVVLMAAARRRRRQE
ncbi:hypothetical protein [Actinorhabdospora filicis]|nr:hypothetical protein [Actinorhabdospora filicis]